MVNKRLLFYVMTVVLSLMQYGCQEDGTSVYTYVELSENSVVFDENGATKVIDISVYPEGTAWQVDADDQQEWFTFESMSDGVEVTALPNYSGESREGIINITSPEGKFDELELKVVQEAGRELKFSTSLADYAFDSEGGRYTFTVMSNYSWKVTSDASWLKVTADETGLVVLSAEPNLSENALSAIVTVTAGMGDHKDVVQCVVKQETRAENKYLRLLGQWEITASKWYYSPNGSLNSLDYNPSPKDYCLIFDLVADKYNETFLMKNFLYPGTELQVRFDRETGGIVIPFGWAVYDSSVFLYVTLVGNRQFAYASVEAKATPSNNATALSLDLPGVDGFTYVGFGLWTYNDDGNKVAFGYSSRPTMFPMSPIVFNKQYLETQQK